MRGVGLRAVGVATGLAAGGVRPYPLAPSPSQSDGEGEQSISSFDRLRVSGLWRSAAAASRGRPERDVSASGEGIGAGLLSRPERRLLREAMREMV